MDPQGIGRTISVLRRRLNMTQAELADRLKVSSKTVSKWESGLGYPEITQFPVLAELFGVTIDYLMTGERKGIAVAGYLVTDLVKNIERFPEVGMLTIITGSAQAVGGCVPNVAINLAKIQRGLPIFAIGKVGDDEYGRFQIATLQKHGVDTGGISVSDTLPTAFCDVMSLPSGERTFFSAQGANVEFSPADIDLNTLNCKILHIGYLLLLNQFDKPDGQYGTVMARFLRDAQQKGIKTSIDTVSDAGADYSAVVVPALKYCNYAIMNELECCAISGLEAYRPEGQLLVENVRRAMENMVAWGVQERVIVHAKSAGFCLDAVTGTFTVIPSLKIPPEHIKGSVGAGDAFAAGCLYGIYHGYTDEAMLRFASAAAACNLFAENAIDGMRPKQEILKMEEQFGRLEGVTV